MGVLWKVGQSRTIMLKNLRQKENFSEFFQPIENYYNNTKKLLTSMLISLKIDYITKFCVDAPITIENILN